MRPEDIDKGEHNVAAEADASVVGAGGLRTRRSRFALPPDEDVSRTEDLAARPTPLAAAPDAPMSPSSSSEGSLTASDTVSLAETADSRHTPSASAAASDAHVAATADTLVPSSLFSVSTTTAGRSLSASRRVSAMTRHTGQRELSKLEFHAYLSRTNEKCLYTAVYESLIHEFQLLLTHPIQLVGDVLTFQRNLADEMNTHRAFYLDDIVVEFIKALRKNHLSHFSLKLREEIGSLIKKKSLLTLLKSSEREAYALIRKYLEEDNGILTYCDWIRTPGTAMSEAALKAVSQLYQVKIFIYHKDVLKKTRVPDPAYHGLYIQQEHGKYYQLVPRSHVRDQLVLPFFNVEPEIAGFSPNPPRYYADARCTQAQPSSSSQPTWSEAGELLGQRFYEFAKRAVLHDKTDPFNFHHKVEPLSPLALLKSFVADVSAREKIVRKKLVLDYKRFQGELSAIQYKRILEKKRDLLHEFLAKKPKVGKILTSQELAKQLEVQAKPIIEITLALFESQLAGEETHWIGGHELTAAEAREEFRRNLLEKIAEYQKLPGSYRSYEYVSPSDRVACAERLKAEAAVSPESYYAQHAYALASDRSVTAAKPTLEEERTRVSQELLGISQELDHLHAILQGFNCIKAAFDLASGAVVATELPRVLRHVQLALISLGETRVLGIAVQQAIQSLLKGIQDIVQGLLARQSTAFGSESSEDKARLARLLKASDLAPQYLHELTDAILLLNAVKNLLSTEERYTLIAHHLAEINHAPESAWMTPLTLEEVRVRFMLFLDHFIEEAVAAYRDSLEFHPDLLEYDEAAGRFVKRSKSDEGALDRIVARYQQRLEEVLSSHRRRVGGWTLAEQKIEETSSSAAKKPVSVESLAESALVEVQQEIDSLNKILMNPEGDLHTHLQTLSDQYEADATLAKKVRLHVMLGEEGCRAAYGLELQSVINTLLRGQNLARMEQTLYEMKELDLLQRFNPEATPQELSFLLEKGLSPDACDAEGMSLLHHLVDREEGFYDNQMVELAEYLFRCMASVDVLDRSQRTAGGIVHLQHLFFKEYGYIQAHEAAYRVLAMCEQAHLRRQFSYEYALLADKFVTEERSHLFHYDQIVRNRQASFFGALARSTSMQSERAAQRNELGKMTDGLEVSPHEAPLVVPKILDMTTKANKGFLATITLGLMNASKLIAPTASAAHEFADTHSYATMVMTFQNRRHAYRERLQAEQRRGRVRVASAGAEDLVARKEAADAKQGLADAKKEAAENLAKAKAESDAKITTIEQRHTAIEQRHKEEMEAMQSQLESMRIMLFASMRLGATSATATEPPAVELHPASSAPAPGQR